MLYKTKGNGYQLMSVAPEITARTESIGQGNIYVSRCWHTLAPAPALYKWNVPGLACQEVELNDRDEK
jgi:hypothetical protein